MSVLLRGGRRDVGAMGGPVAIVVAEPVGEGVEDDIFEAMVEGDYSLCSSLNSES